MKLKSPLLAFLAVISFNLLASDLESTVSLTTDTGTLEGSLLLPNKNATGVPVALIIAGSGPTDRNGNNPAMTNNALKLLAEALAAEGIASLRYDKRGVAKSAGAMVKEDDLRFETYASDASQWVALLNKDQRFSGVTVIGHSEGALLGTLVAQQQSVAAFISIAGTGISAHELLKTQLQSQPPQVLDIALPIIDQLAQGKRVADVNPMFNALFRPSVQPYLISWFKYDPAQELAKVTVPILILQGTTDLQVSVQDANLLAAANPKAQQIMIENMNHVLKQASADQAQNMQTYNAPDLPIKPELVSAIVTFMQPKNEQ